MRQTTNSLSVVNVILHHRERNITIQIVKSDVTQDNTKYKYVPLNGSPGSGNTLLIQVGKYAKNLPITEYQTNGDTPCMDPTNYVSYPNDGYDDIFQENDYQFNRDLYHKLYKISVKDDWMMNDLPRSE